MQQGGLQLTEQLMCLSGAYTLASSTSSQKLFNGSTNGALTLQPGLYFFECLYSLSSMSATSGNAKFDVLGAGTATATAAFANMGVDATTQTTAAAASGAFTAGTINTGDGVVAATGTGMWELVKGVLRVTVAGTIIPSVALTTAATPAVAANSYFRINCVGDSGDTNAGNWS